MFYSKCLYMSYHMYYGKNDNSWQHDKTLYILRKFLNMQQYNRHYNFRYSHNYIRWDWQHLRLMAYWPQQ